MAEMYWLHFVRHEYMDSEERLTEHINCYSN